jgi:acetyltransferase-like isoleucine patch superfamily enzyme
VKISVITINLNRREELRRTLDSLQRQSDRDFELVVVDGGSTDGSTDVLQSYSDLIATSVSEKDAGIHDAWNKGIRLSTGDVVALLNAGDEYHPGVIATIRAFYGADWPGRSAVILTGRVLMVRDGTIVKAIGNRLRSNLILGIGFAHPAMIATRRVYAEVGEYANISIASDSEFILRCVRHGVAFVPGEFRVYMDASGISQRAAARGFAQYVDALVRLKFCSRFAGRTVGAAYALYRRIAGTRALNWLRSLAANARHFAVRLLNFTQWLCFFRPLRGWVLRCLGLRVHPTAFVSPSVTLYRTGNVCVGPGSVINREVILDNRDLVNIGTGCSISYGARIITAGHDIDSPYFEYYSLPITIEDHVAIFAGATVLPGSVLRRGVVVLAGSVISGDTIENGVYGGVPAKLVRLRSSSPRHKFDYHRPFAL